MSARRDIWLVLITMFWLSLSPHAHAQMAATGGVEIAITEQGFQPPKVTIIAGQSVHWTNVSDAVHQVTDDSGLFASTPLAPGAGFSIAIAVPGQYSYQSPDSPGFSGEIRVGLSELSGPADGLANAHIPDFPFILETPDDLSPHPTYGMLTSRTRIVLGFTETATVSQANAALQSAKVAIIGGLPRSKILLAGATDTADFSALFAAIEALRAAPAVAFAAMSSETSLNALPAPAESALAGPEHNWRWEVISDPVTQQPLPLGSGGNWGLEASRVPQMWNLLEVIRRRGEVPPVITAVIDGGFQKEHEDLNIDIKKLCLYKFPKPQKCTGDEADAHGNHVAGIIGATFNNTLDKEEAEAGRSRGISGVNPVARIAAVRWKFTGFDSTLADILQVLELSIDEIPQLRVVNISMGLRYPNPQVWWQQFGTVPVCGPELGDDGVAIFPDICTPNNEDGWLAHVKNVGMSYKKVAERAAKANVMIVQATGNGSDQFCLGEGAPSYDSCFALRADTTAHFAWVSAHWDAPGLSNPIILAEAITPDLRRLLMSNISGDVSPPNDGFISAPGEDVLSTVLDDDYGFKTGTSMAAPHIAGVLGYLLAYDPSLSIADLRTHLLQWRRADTTQGASPRLDAFASLLSIAGGAKDLVDVNDESEDGNQRVILGGGKKADEIVGRDTDYFTQSDGIVNMRDFRRFRDAWLQNCAASIDMADCAIFSSDASKIALDGPADHWKKDLNFDRCVNQGETDVDCPTPEAFYLRFDFNGDGIVSRTAATRVPLKPDGSPAANPGEAAMMTDLEVLMSQWEGDSAQTEGWYADDLQRHDLMVSGDLEIHADTFFASGANQVEVSIRRLDSNELLPRRTIKPADEFIVFTVPALVPLAVTMSAPNHPQLFAPTQEITLKAGEDRRFDPCASTLSLSAHPPTLVANGSAQAQIVADLIACSGEEKEHLTVTFFQTPAGGAHGKLDTETALTDADGQATVTFSAGTEQANYVITGNIELDNGRSIESSVTIMVGEPIKIFYRWQQTVLQFTEQGSSRWPPFDPSDLTVDQHCDAATITGTVLDPGSGQPVEHALVELLGIDAALTNLYGQFIFTNIPVAPNTPQSQVTLRTSANGLNDERQVTLFCSALIELTLGSPPAPTNTTIEGTVTNVVTGLPLPGVFIGSSFGVASVTDANGTYKFTDVPLGPNQTSRTWNVTAVAPAFPPQVRFVDVMPGATSQLHFGLSSGDCDGYVVERFLIPDSVSITEIGPDGALRFSTDLVEDWVIPVIRTLHDGNVVKTLGFKSEGLNLSPEEIASILSAGEWVHSIGWNTCTDNFTFEAKTLPPEDGGFRPPVLALSREGSLELVGDRVRLDEFVTGSETSGTFAWESSSSAPADPDVNPEQLRFAGNVRMSVLPDEIERYQDYVLPPTVSIDVLPQGLRISGLYEIAELEYPYEASWDFDLAELGGINIAPITLSTIGFGDVAGGIGAMMAATHQPELMLVPRGDGSALRFAADVNHPLVFESDAEGNFEPYRYCQIVERQYTTSREYFSGFDLEPPQYWRRNTTFSYDSWFHEYPMPVGPGSATMQYSFIAIPYSDEASLETMLLAGQLDAPTDCEAQQVPDASFGFSPTQPKVGETIQFVDLSSSAGNTLLSWEWDFGDNTISFEKEPTHIYNTAASFTVTLKVKDAAGTVGSETVVITVGN